MSPFQQWLACHMQGEHQLQKKHDQAQAWQDHLQHLPKPIITHNNDKMQLTKCME